MRRLLRVIVRELQSRLATALGVSRARRIETVVRMLENNARRAPGYWLQLVLATGIATLGLVLGSTAVVIGGMLVSPLMGPIVELGMGFAVGSSVLVIRAFLRVLLSVVAVVVAAALITMALPFQEVTSEIATRTAPTLLDLLVAAFCALAAAYTTVRQTAETTAAAAGTAIGIALVPPLCVTGFGIGTRAPSIAAGAGLLFTANFSAILLLAVLSFLLLGYNQVEAAVLEHDYLEPHQSRADRVADRVQHALHEAFGSRFGLAVRLLVPLVLLGAVAIPLKRALDEVAWEVRARDSVRRALASEGVRAVQSTLAVERHTVALRLVVIGSPEAAEALERRLVTRIAAAAGVEPAIAVSAVPDAAALELTLAAERRTARTDAPPTVDIGAAERLVGAALRASWPAQAAGPLIGWTLELTPRGAPQLSTRHLGPSLGAAAEQMLGRAVAAAIQSAPVVIDSPLPAQPVAASSPTDTGWVSSAVETLARVRTTDGAVACVTRPAPGTGASARRRPRGGLGALSQAAVEQRLRSTPAGRAGLVTMRDSTIWSIRVALGACVAPSDSVAAGAGGGARGAANAGADAAAVTKPAPR